MTMPTPEKIDAYAGRLLEAAQAMVADPDSMEVRKAYMRRTFNLDWTAAAIVKLAETTSQPQPRAPEVDGDRARDEHLQLAPRQALEAKTGPDQ